MSRRIVEKILLVCAILSFVITFTEGCLYYDYINNSLFRILIILQNSIKAFVFRTDITIEKMLENLEANPGMIRSVVGYAYGIACFFAPYCTLSFGYRLITRFARVNLLIAKRRKYRHVIIFGYNNEVKALLYKKQYIEKEKIKIHIVVADKLSENDEADILRNKYVLHTIDFLNIEMGQLNYYLKKIEACRATEIILFEESSSRNFSLYTLFTSKEARDYLREEKKLKYFCRCEDYGVEQVLQDYYDHYVKNELKSDLQIVSVPELRIKKMLREHPLHSYHLTNEEKKNSNNTNYAKDMNSWNLHMLIIGFGKMGQQLLLQAMNQGVTGSKNEILIDVVDFNMEKQKNIFSNRLSDEYFEITENEFIISEKKADGRLKIRFRGMDVRYRQFDKLLQELGGEKAFTYVVVCLEDLEASLQCMTRVNRYLNSGNTERRTNPERICCGIRMDFDNSMEQYISRNQDTYKNVFTIETANHSISLKELLDDDIDKDAKDLNFSYSTVCIEEESKKEEVKHSTNKSNHEDKEKPSSDDNSKKDEKWRERNLNDRDSNRALAEHNMIKEIFINNVSREQLNQWFGTDSEIFKYENGKWLYNKDKLIEKMREHGDYDQLSEYARMEHRRWCYFMAASGWKYKDIDKKDPERLIHPDMVPWEKLADRDPGVCVYDLTSLIVHYIKPKKDNKESSD